jgi:hypothetical protein
MAAKHSNRLVTRADYEHTTTRDQITKPCLGVGHQLQEDDVYNGYFIPKGTRILPLEWYVN